MITKCLDVALRSARCGISVVLPRQDGTKAPDAQLCGRFGKWEHRMRDRASENEIKKWFEGGRTGVGWICGNVSGDLLIIDFDDRSTFSEYKKACHDAGIGHLLDRIMNGYCEHSPNGAHIAVRVSPCPKSDKLARKRNDDKIKTLIETRGEGGFIIVAPTHGGVNKGGPYVLQSGSVETIQTITKNELESLFDVARIFDEETRPIEEKRTIHVTDGNRPGDDFNRKSSWSEILEPHGWKKVFSRLGVTSWRRPGKDFGLSATTNYQDSDLLYVFSSSTQFEPNRGYSKFSAYALLNHDNDFSLAAHELILQGYGIEDHVTDDDVDLSVLLNNFGKSKIQTGFASPKKINELLKVPGLVGEFADWISETSTQVQPILALGGSIAALSCAIGRKVRSYTGLRSNLYVLGVGQTCSGKEHARESIKKLYETLGQSKRLGSNFASGSAAENAIFQNPSSLFLVDEIGHLVAVANDEKAPSHIRELIPILLTLYSESKSSHTRKNYALSKEPEKEYLCISQPCLSIYGCTTPQKLYKSISKANLSDGFLGRFLVFETEDNDPEFKWVDSDLFDPPKSIIERYKFWIDAPINPYDSGNLANVEHKDQVPNPLKVTNTQKAHDIFDDLAATMRRRRAEIRSQGDDQGPYGRVVEMAIKLAMIRACGINLDRPEITAEDAQWGCDLAWSNIERMMLRVGQGAAENKTEEAAIRIKEIVRIAGQIKHRDVTRKTQWLSRQQRADAIATLIESGEISQEKTGQTFVYSVH